MVRAQVQVEERVVAPEAGLEMEGVVEGAEGVVEGAEGVVKYLEGVGKVVAVETAEVKVVGCMKLAAEERLP